MNAKTPPNQKIPQADPPRRNNAFPTLPHFRLPSSAQEPKNKAVLKIILKIIMKHISSLLVAVALLCGAGMANGQESEEVRWFIKATKIEAEQGDSVAQTLLGVMYALGQGVPQDNVEAVKWYRKAAEQGVATAQNQLGDMYFRGRGVTKNSVESAKWYRKAAEQGHAQAQYNLGWWYRAGRPLDPVEAVKWFRKAAEQGHADATNMLGNLYYWGDGVPKNYEESAKWYRKAAEQGFARGQLNLSKAYLQAKGVPKNYIESYAWALLAKANADVTSSRFGAFEDHISDLEKILTAEQWEKVKARALELHRLIEERKENPKPSVESP